MTSWNTLACVINKKMNYKRKDMIRRRHTCMYELATFETRHIKLENYSRQE